MTPEQITIAVAELDGFTPIWIEGDRRWYQDWSVMDRPTPFKPYTTSRDAIIPVIEKFIDKGWMLIQHVADEVGYDKEKHPPFMLASLCLTATPLQLCTALLKATGKWIE